MQISKKYLEITILSRRSFIIDFCQNQLREFGRISVINSLNLSDLRKNSVLILDVLSFYSQVSLFFKLNINYPENIFFLISQECDNSVLNICEKKYANIVYFPSTFELIRNYCKKLSAIVDLSYYIDIGKMI